MLKRTKTGQRQHDLEVLRWAKQKKKEGFSVDADLPGWPKPSKVKGDIPDAFAIRGREKKLLEVETIDTLSSDQQQRSKFRKWSATNKNKTFYVKVVKK